jgi:phage shock protein C
MDERPVTSMPEPTPIPTTDTAPQPKRLHRSQHQKLLMGICGGLAEYFDLDPTIVRILFVAGVVIGGASIVLYAVLALIMPAESMLDAEPRVAARATLDEVDVELRRVGDEINTKLRDVFGRRPTS